MTFRAPLVRRPAAAPVLKASRAAEAEAEAERWGASVAEELAGPCAESVPARWSLLGSLQTMAWRPREVQPLVDRAGPGSPLRVPGLERPLEHVRVHADARAAQWNNILRADAFTVGNHVFLGAATRAAPSAEARRIIGHELVHVAQQARTTPTLQCRSREPEVADKLGFWSSQGDAADALAILAAMSGSDFNDTLAEMCRTRSVARLIQRLDAREQVVRFLSLVGDRATQANKEALFVAQPLLNLGPENHLLVFGRKHAAAFGERGEAPPAALASSFLPKDPMAPFSGMSPRGFSPREAPISILEMLALRSQAKRADELPRDVDPKYERLPDLEMMYDWSNPIKGDLVGPGSWLAARSQLERNAQARLLFQREIVTDSPGAHAGGLPTRLQVIRAAAAAHRLRPELVAAFILAEQRDQSEHEDAADYKKATLAKRPTASVGLGQVTIKTAREHDLFADLLAPSFREALAKPNDHSTVQIAHLLASDEFNIFAVARYIRKVADIGATKDIHDPSLEKAAAWVGEIDLALYAQPSSQWTMEHIRLLGSEYTSKPFDPGISAGWGDFVFEAYRDILIAKIF